MNTTMKTIIDENNMKFNYFKSLVDTNKINLSADLVVAKIKPKFNTFVSTNYFLNNILNNVFTKQLLFNFSRNVRDIKYNKMKNNFENLLKFNRPLFEETFLEEIKEALDNTKLSIPAKYNNYIIQTDFDNNYIYCIAKHLLFLMTKNTYEYMTPTKYKKMVLENVKEHLSKQTNNYIIHCFKKTYNFPHIYYRNGGNPITVKFSVKYDRFNETEKLSHSNKLHLLLMK